MTLKGSRKSGEKMRRTKRKKEEYSRWIAATT